jgi:hypothetical protein
MATVSALTYYPIKGCAGVTVDRAEVTPTGLAHDRSFIVTTPDGVTLTQRTAARLATIRAQVLHAGTKLALSAPAVDDLILDVNPDGPLHDVTVHKWQGAAHDQGNDAATWFSEILGTPARLLRASVGLHREGSGDTPGQILYSDSTALLITSLSSLDNLNARLLEKGSDPLPMNRFRPNIVVSGWPDPHTEDKVHRLRIGPVEIAYGERDIRCVVTTVDQLAGVRSGPEPLRTLAEYRHEPEGGVSFGMKAAVLVPGEILVGDEIAVTSWL